MNYPDHLSTQKSTFGIAHLSDLHLSRHHLEHQEHFLAVLQMSLTTAPDLLLLTGDLVNDGLTADYDWLFHVLDKTNVPYLCLAGNHDVSVEHGHDLPFQWRTLSPITKDKRLIEHHRLHIAMPNLDWQLLAINSAVSGQSYGQIDKDGLNFLNNHLKTPTPTLIATHHHPLPVGSAWIDELMLKNADEFWQIVRPHHEVRAILSGHVHQAHAIDVPMMTDCTFYTTPATARQFLPFNDDFALDTMSGGFRLITLGDDGTLTTCIIRLP